MYCNHDYWSPVVGTLWILCAVTACVPWVYCDWMDLFSPPPCLHDLCIRVRFSCCIVIPQTSVQKSIEDKITKISLFIDVFFFFSFFLSEGLAVVFGFYGRSSLCRGRVVYRVNV